MFEMCMSAHCFSILFLSSRAKFMAMIETQVNIDLFERVLRRTSVRFMLKFSNKNMRKKYLINLFILKFKINSESLHASNYASNCDKNLGFYMTRVYKLGF